MHQVRSQTVSLLVLITLIVAVTVLAVVAVLAAYSVSLEPAPVDNSSCSAESLNYLNGQCD